MAAVAGAVADEVLAAMKNADGLDSVFVNNGGDIALHLEPGQKMRVGIVPCLSIRPKLDRGVRAARCLHFPAGT